MDAFLRRVAEQRELEQEARLIERPLKEFAPPKCRVCRGELNATPEDREQATVCSACGGRKRERQLQREDELRELAVTRTAMLLSLAGIRTRGETRMNATAAVERLCTKCGKRLRSDNTGVDCSRCKTGPKSVAVEALGGGTTRARPDVRKKFRIVADALGFDGDALIDSFCNGWLERVRGSVTPLEEDKDLT